MSDIEMTHEKKSVESLPANSSWGKFFLAMYFGRNYFRFSGRASRKEFWGPDTGKCVYVFNYIGGLPFFKGDRKDNKFGKNIYGEE